MRANQNGTLQFFLRARLYGNLLQFYTEAAKLGAELKWKSSLVQRSTAASVAQFVARRSAARKIFPRTWLFYRGRNKNFACFQYVTFGLRRATREPEGGRRAEDPFRGLRAGPARSSPRLLPPPTPKPHPMDHTHRRKHVYTPLHKILRSKYANWLSAKLSRLNPQVHPSKYVIHVRREKLA